MEVGSVKSAFALDRAYSPVNTGGATGLMYEVCKNRVISGPNSLEQLCGAK